MGGGNKAFLDAGGLPVISRVAAALRTVSNDIFIVSNTPEEYLSLDLPVVADIVPIRCPLSGIHSALASGGGSHCLVVPCDLPFLSPRLLRLIAEHVAPDLDIVIPETHTGMEPLCAVYSKRCVRRAESVLLSGNYKIRSMLGGLRVLKLREDLMRKADPPLLSFLNLNTPADLARARRIIQEGGHGDIWGTGEEG
jgi:molybdopterin-guanine dinucleotide biosynthesis protein A